MTLSTAVAIANDDINHATWKDPDGNIVAPVKWHIVGEGTVHF